MTHITDATVWIVSTRGMADASAADEAGYTTGAHEALMVKVADYEAARAEVASLHSTIGSLRHQCRHEETLRIEYHRELELARAEVATLKTDRDWWRGQAIRDSAQLATLTTALEQANKEREEMRANDARWKAVRENAAVYAGVFRFPVLDKSKHTTNRTAWSGGARLESAVDEYLSPSKEPAGE